MDVPQRFSTSQLRVLLPSSRTIIQMSPNIFHPHNSNSRNTTQSTITDSHNDSSVYEHYQLNFTNCTLYIHPAAIQEIPFVSPGDSAQYQNFQTHTDSVHENTNIGGGAQDQYRQHSELTAERPRVRRAHNPFSASPEPSFQPASQACWSIVLQRRFWIAAAGAERM